MPEVGGDSALLCNPRSVEDIAEKIEYGLSDEIQSKKMVEKGFEQIKKFSWEASARKLHNLIQSY